MAIFFIGKDEVKAKSASTAVKNYVIKHKITKFDKLRGATIQVRKKNGGNKVYPVRIKTVKEGARFKTYSIDGEKIKSKTLITTAIDKPKARSTSSSKKRKASKPPAKGKAKKARTKPKLTPKPKPKPKPVSKPVSKPASDPIPETSGSNPQLNAIPPTATNPVLSKTLGSFPQSVGATLSRPLFTGGGSGMGSMTSSNVNINREIENRLKAMSNDRNAQLQSDSNIQKLYTTLNQANTSLNNSNDKTLTLANDYVRDLAAQRNDYKSKADSANESIIAIEKAKAVTANNLADTIRAEKNSIIDELKGNLQKIGEGQKQALRDNEDDIVKLLTGILKIPIHGTEQVINVPDNATREDLTKLIIGVRMDQAQNHTKGEGIFAKYKQEIEGLKERLTDKDKDNEAVNKLKDKISEKKIDISYHDAKSRIETEKKGDEVVLTAREKAFNAIIGGYEKNQEDFYKSRERVEKAEIKSTEAREQADYKTREEAEKADAKLRDKRQEYELKRESKRNEAFLEAATKLNEQAVALGVSQGQSTGNNEQAQAQVYLAAQRQQETQEELNKRNEELHIKDQFVQQQFEESLANMRALLSKLYSDVNATYSFNVPVNSEQIDFQSHPLMKAIELLKSYITTIFTDDEEAARQRSIVRQAIDADVEELNKSPLPTKEAAAQMNEVVNKIRANLS